MGLCQGKEIDMKELISPEQKALREQLIGMVMDKLQAGAGATPYTGPMSPQINPLMMGAANIAMGKYLGQGYDNPSFMNYSQLGGPEIQPPTPMNPRPPQNQDTIDQIRKNIMDTWPQDLPLVGPGIDPYNKTVPLQAPPFYYDPYDPRNQTPK